MSPKKENNKIQDIFPGDDHDEVEYQEIPGMDPRDLSPRYKILNERRVLDGKGGYYPLRSYVNTSIISQLVIVFMLAACSILPLLLKIISFVGMILLTYIESVPL